MIFRYVWLQNPQVMRTDFTELLPTLTLDVKPGTMNFLHFLQKFIRISYGILTRCFVLSLLARLACLSANSGFDLAFDMAFLIRICILSIIRSFSAAFTLVK